MIKTKNYWALIDKTTKDIVTCSNNRQLFPLKEDALTYKVLPTDILVKVKATYEVKGDT
jgi:hypothetical protein